MTAARRIALSPEDDALLDELATRIAAKLRAPKRTVRALPEHERQAAIVAGAGHIWTDAEHARLRDVAATMPVFVRVCQERREAIRERDEAQAALVGLRESLPRLAEMAFRAGYDKCTETWAPDVDEDSDGSCPECGCGQDRDGWDEAFRALPEMRAEIASIVESVIPNTPATLAGQVRARVFREAADSYEAATRLHKPPPATWLRALADEAERAK